MKKLGGARVWEWRPQHLEAKLVTLGLEEPNIDERTHSRRRKRAAQRRRASSQNQQNSAIMPDWTNGLGVQVPHPMIQPPHSYPMGPQPSQYEVVSHPNCLTPNFTPEQNEKILDDIFKGAIKAEPEGTITPDGMEIVYEANESRATTPARKGNFDQRQQVARQVCELVRPPLHR